METFFEYLTHLTEPFVLEQLWIKFEIWAIQNVLIWSNLVQLGLIAGAFIAALLVAPRLQRRMDRISRGPRLEMGLRRACRALSPLTLPLVWLLLQWTSVLVATQAGWPHQLIEVTVSLLTAWVIIRFAAQLVRDETWSKVIAVTAWTVAALNILDLLDDTIVLLNRLAIDIGDLRLSALVVIKGLISLAILLWLAATASRFLEQRILTLPNLTPSVQVLFAKLLKIVLITIAIVAAISSVGIDLTAFAVFGGAIGVGIGFGLQKVVSNLISGVILLMDKSVKPGDVIEVGQTYGSVNTLGARYASVVTRDGTEYLIPNEDIITQRVVNWSYSTNAVRLKIPVGVSYTSDIKLAMRLCLEATAETERVIQDPKPNCLMTGFGDSSVDLEVRLWITDPAHGVANVKSDVLLLIWDKFHEHDIEIPFPQRDLHLKQPAEVSVRLRGPGDAPTDPEIAGKEAAA